MLNIALILTGGTICSFADTQTAERKTNASAARTLLEETYRRTHPQMDIRFTSFTPYDILSENLTLQHWNALLFQVNSILSQQYDGIVIAHGTDTLAYTAGMLAAAIEHPSCPILLISANAPLVDIKSNGNANFSAAVQTISDGIPSGVFAVYRNSDGNTYLHQGVYLRQCENFSEDFYSSEMVALPTEKFAASSKTDVLSNEQLCFKDDVLLLYPYVGLRYDAVSLAGIQAVILGSFHSETVNALANSPYSVQTMLERCQKNSVFCGIAPCDTDAQTYESSGNLIRSGLIPLGKIPTSFAFAAAHVAVAKGFRGDEIGKFILQRTKDAYTSLFRCFM